MLTLEPVAGLGNRMRALDSAMALAREVGVPLRVVWTRTPDLNCRFRDLFRAPPGLEVSERSWFHARVARQLAVRLRRYRRFIWDWDVEALVKRGVDIRERGPWDSAFMIPCRRFCNSPAPYVDLIPVAPLQAFIDRYAADFDDHVYGVQVRRVDNGWTINASPTEAFHAEMDRIVSLDPAARFFVATDSPQEEALLRRRYVDRIITHPKILDRNQPQGAKDAVVDLFTLARTLRLLGSCSSSFTDAAAELGGMETTRVWKTVAGADAPAPT